MSVACWPYVDESDGTVLYPCKAIISAQQACDFYVRDERSDYSAYCKFKYYDCTNELAQREADVEKRMEEL